MESEELPDNWCYLSIGELEASGLVDHHQDGNHGDKHPKATDYVVSGIPFVMARDIENNRLDLEHCAFITKELAESLRIGFARSGDVLLTHKATMGRVAIVPDGYDFIMLTPQVTYYRLGNKPGLSNLFLKYAFLGPDFQHQLNSDSDQSTRKYIGITDQKRLRIPVPPEREQASIANVLNSLDDKIELNRKMNETLEAMARALFKSWFVGFDPVRAKAEGRPTGLPAHIAALFPDSFENSELGEIPKGWLIGGTENIAFLNPESWSKTTRPDIIQYVDLANTKWGRIESITPHSRDDAPSRAQRILRPGDTIVGTVRPGNGSYALVMDNGLTGSTGFAVLRPKIPECREFIYLAATAPDNIDRLSHLADGGAYPAISAEIVLPKKFAIPPEVLIQQFSTFVSPMVSKLADNERESRTLMKTRDTLLPKLISGELRLSIDSPTGGATN